jgi:cytochrome c551/c552
MSNRVRAATALLAVAIVWAGAHAEDHRVPPAYRLARDAGCVICHEVESPPHGPNDVLPAAPAFEDVACRYRSDPDAAGRLSSIVIGGSGPRERDRHWAGRVMFQTMYSNELIVSDAQAREIVDWILTLCRAPVHNQPSKRRG